MSKEKQINIPTPGELFEQTVDDIVGKSIYESNKNDFIGGGASTEFDDFEESVWNEAIKRLNTKGYEAEVGKLSGGKRYFWIEPKPEDPEAEKIQTLAAECERCLQAYAFRQYKEPITVELGSAENSAHVINAVISMLTTKNWSVKHEYGKLLLARKS